MVLMLSIGFLFRLEVLQTAQIFGVLPVSEIFAKNVRDVKFRWIRFKILVAMLAILGASLETGLSVIRGLRVGIDMHVAGLAFCVLKNNIL